MNIYVLLFPLHSHCPFSSQAIAVAPAASKWRIFPSLLACNCIAVTYPYYAEASPMRPRKVDALFSANTAINNSEDKIVGGFHYSLDEHSLDTPIQNAQPAKTAEEADESSAWHPHNGLTGQRPRRRLTRLVQNKFQLLSHLRTQHRLRHDADVDILLGANTAIDNPEDKIVHGFHNNAAEHSLDPPVRNAKQAYDFGWEDGMREGMWRMGHHESHHRSSQPTTASKSSDKTHSIQKWLGTLESSSSTRSRETLETLPTSISPPAIPECGAQARSQRLVHDAMIKSANSLHLTLKSYSLKLAGAVEATMAASRLPTPVTPLRTVSEPTIRIARKPVPARKPVLTRAETDGAANVLKGGGAKFLAVREKTIKLLGPMPAQRNKRDGEKESENGGMETLLMLFAVGAAAAWMVCVVGTAVWNKA